jgi:ribosomal protein S17E
VHEYEWFLLSKVKQIAEDFLSKFPSAFSADFEANKRSLSELAIIHNRALRNQIAGAITKMVVGRSPEKSELVTKIGEVSSETMDSETESAEPVAQEAQ